MKRLTTDTPQNNLESALNLFYAKDGGTWVRGGGPEPDYDDVTLFTYIRRALNAFFPGHQFDDVDNDTLSEIMFDWLQYGPESIPGVIAALYESAWAFAEIRERLKAYEGKGLMPDDVAGQKWIPVSERLPERDGQYLCNYHFGNHRDMTFTRVLDYYATDKVPHFQHTLGDTTMKVTHWMPLPEIPKEGK